MNHQVVFAALTLKDMKGPGITDLWKSETSSLRETVLIIAVLFTVAVALLIWAAFVRKRRRTRHHGRRNERGLLLTASEQKEHRHRRSFFGFRKRQKQRRHRYRQRNPSLAETGGLPPIRRDTTAEDTAS